MSDKEIFELLLTTLIAIASLAAVFISLVSLYMSNQALKLTRTQIAESQRQFELANEPFLQIELEELAPQSVDNWLKEIRYKINNLGNNPVKITYGHRELVTDSSREIKYQDTYSPHLINIFVIKETQYATLKTVFALESDPDPETQEMIGKLRNSEKHLFFTGYYYYMNLVTKQLNKYEFLIRFFKTEPYATFLHNKNYKIPKGTFTDENDF
ncbi:MAG: hypothetical protein JNK14_15385 [Chitinophagaceae bacterium]|nr:hypothetical protein [Chitinophagaceae bacterium]